MGRQGPQGVHHQRVLRPLGDHAKNLEFVCSDMWKPYLKVIALRASSAIHVLDRFHIMSMLSKVIDKVRAEEVKKLEADGYDPVLIRSRWLLLKRPEKSCAQELSQ
ncbi:MAG: transposase [bacterium]|nr:transposase [bacterium]